MTFNKSALAASISLVTLALAGCGGGAGSQDSGSSTSSVKLSGLVVDPYVAQAKVYVDLNNDGIHQFSTEDFAYTDKDGYFSKSKRDANGKSNDYCSGSTAVERYCLSTSQIKDGAVLRIEGGYDVASGQPFTGSIAMTLDLSKGAQELGAANPLISLYTAAKLLNTTQQQAILDFIGNGLTIDDLKSDFLKEGAVDGAKFQKAMQIHKAAAMITVALDHKYELKPTSKKVNGKLPPATAGSFVYPAIAAMLAGPVNSQRVTAPDKNNWKTVLDEAEKELIEKTDKSAATWHGNGSEKDAVAKRVAALFDWFENTHGNTLTASDVTADTLYQYARVADVVVNQTKREIEVSNSTTPMSDTTESVSEKILRDNNTPSSVNANFTPEADLDSLAATTTPSSISYAKFEPTAKLFDGTTNNITNHIANKKLVLTYTQKEGETKTGTVHLYFSGADGNSEQGKLVACLQATGDTSDLQEVKDLATGLYVAGRWSKLNNYAVTAAITEPVTPEQALIVKRTNAAETGDTFQFSLDATTGLETWTGNLETYSSLPTNSADCKENLGVN